MTSPSLTLHHLQCSQAERIPWLLEELGLPYDLKPYKRAPIFGPPELKAVHPLGASPVLEDATSDPSSPLILAESGAIADYIIYKYGNGRLALAPSHANYADYLYWFHFANGNLQPAVMRCMTAKSLASPDNPRVKMAEDHLQTVFSHVNERLKKNTWLAGDEFTAADIMSLFCFTTMRKFMPADLTNYPGIVAWVRRCADRPAYQAAMKKGDPELDIGDLVNERPPEMFEALKMMISQQAQAQNN
ncbi:glutathione S-transferase [Lojkania enalia]|uniref:Glutathione S-transferase n=1 Tax=Lojkania enalia TaxID=147567 RepID=A0A9P4NAD4_9PLEO|nr:glutathione S-transferase [Didymosphaeria enalia]